MAGWMNDDGLYVKFGTEEGVSSHAAGTYASPVGGVTITEVDIVLSSLTATETILNDAVWIPANAHILWVDTITVVAAATGTAIDVGLIDQDRSTEIDYDGLLAAWPAANGSVVGETVRFTEAHTVVAGATGTGALVGTELTNTGYVSASRTDATAFTAGKIRVQIGWIPKGLDNFT
jgi:hypothetical protein